MVIDGSIHSDQMLISQARAGGRAAFDQLVERYFGTVWAIAYARMGRRDSADDLAQEVFLVAWLHLQSLSDPSRFAGWLSQITYHRTTDWIRQQQQRSKLVELVPIENLDCAGSIAKESAMERNEEDQLVRKAVFDLPAQQREIVLLKFTEGLNQNQIADRLEVHPGTVGRTLQRALTSLRRSLTAFGDDSIATLRPSQNAAAKTTALLSSVAAMS